MVEIPKLYFCLIYLKKIKNKLPAKRQTEYRALGSTKSSLPWDLNSSRTFRWNPKWAAWIRPKSKRHIKLKAREDGKKCCSAFDVLLYLQKILIIISVSGWQSSYNNSLNQSLHRYDTAIWRENSRGTWSWRPERMGKNAAQHLTYFCICKNNRKCKINKRARFRQNLVFV